MKPALLAASSCTFLSIAALVGQLAAQTAVQPQRAAAPAAGGFAAHPIGGGADIIVGSVSGVQNWGGLSGTSAHSLGTTVCNTGDVPLSFEQFDPQHPVAAQNIYRVSALSNGATRIEQLGQSWVFHYFCALQQTLCGTCTPSGGGCDDALGVGCSNPDTAQRMGSQNNLGPRYSINASTGVFTLTPPMPPITTPPGSLIGKRIQLAVADLDPALNPAATYFGEIVVVHPQDAQAGHGADNASHRRLNVGALSGTPPNQFYALAMSGSTVQMLPALHAWQAADPSVSLSNIDVPDDGRFVLGFDVTDLGDGTWHYEYAILNINSHRSGQAFSVPIPKGVAVTNIGFKDVDYHTQQILEPAYQVDNVDWTATLSDGALTWATSEYTGPSPAGNENTANALRWGTMYNFRFDADAPPATVNATLALFRPGMPDKMSIELLGPGAPPPPPDCPADLSGDGIVNGFDLAMLLGAWGNCPLDSICGCPADFDCSGEIDGFDLALLLGAWGDC